MKQYAIGMCVGLTILGMVGIAQAGLENIGTAQIGGAGAEFNLIYDNDKELVWLDYSNSAQGWVGQQAWAAGLSGSLTYNINPSYVHFEWLADQWRLPSTVDGAGVYGFAGDPYNYTTGYNLSNSEMGHLFYDELGNDGNVDTAGNSQFGALANTGLFENLNSGTYWSGNEYTNYIFGPTGEMTMAWAFVMANGEQNFYGKGMNFYGFAVRSAYAETPEPATMILLGTGLVGLAGSRLRRKKK